MQVFFDRFHNHPIFFIKCAKKGIFYWMIRVIFLLGAFFTIFVLEVEEWVSMFSLQVELSPKKPPKIDTSLLK